LEERALPYPDYIAGVVLTVGDGAVWALERGLGRVRRIDPATKDAPVRAEGGFGDATSIAVHGNGVWLGGGDGVTKLDLHDGSELGSVPVPDALFSTTTSIAVDDDAVWFVGDSSTRLWRIDPEDVSTVNSFPIGASPSAVAVADDGAVWVAGRSVTWLWRLDLKKNHGERIPVGATSGGLVAAYHRMWTSPDAAEG